MAQGAPQHAVGVHREIACADGGARSAIVGGAIHRTVRRYPVAGKLVASLVLAVLVVAPGEGVHAEHAVACVELDGDRAAGRVGGQVLPAIEGLAEAHGVVFVAVARDAPWRIAGQGDGAAGAAQHQLRSAHARSLLPGCDGAPDHGAVAEFLERDGVIAQLHHVRRRRTLQEHRGAVGTVSEVRHDQHPAAGQVLDLQAAARPSVQFVVEAPHSRLQCEPAIEVRRAGRGRAGVDRAGHPASPRRDDAGAVDLHLSGEKALAVESELFDLVGALLLRAGGIRADLRALRGQGSSLHLVGAGIGTEAAVAAAELFQPEVAVGQPHPVRCRPG